MNIQKGDVLLVNFEPAKGSEQGKTRPAVVVQNDIGNRYSPNTIVVPITSTIKDKNYPIDIVASADELGLQNEGTIICSQIVTISVHHRVIKKLSSLKSSTLEKVNLGLKSALGID